MIKEQYIQNLNKILTEAEKKSRVDVKDKTKDQEFKFADPASKGELSSKTTNKAIEPKIISKDKVAKKLSTMHAPTGSPEVMRRFLDKVDGLTDEIPNQELEHTNTPIVGAEQEPKVVTPDNLPALINKSLTAQGDVVRTVDVEWMQLSDTPGYVLEQIRAAFRPLFKYLTNTPLEKVCVTTDLIPGLASSSDIKQLAGYLLKYGVKDDGFSLEAFDIPKEMYHIEHAEIVHMGGVSYLILKEKLMGMTHYYIYCSTSRGTKVTSKADTKRLS